MLQHLRGQNVFPSGVFHRVPPIHRSHSPRPPCQVGGDVDAAFCKPLPQELGVPADGLTEKAMNVKLNVLQLGGSGVA